jgi:phosphoglycolate phosphatase
MGTDGQKRLVLWDIDRTLIASRGMGRLVYERVFPAVTGQALREVANLNGQTDLRIMHDTLTMHGIVPTEQLMRRLANALADGYRDARDELVSRGCVLPGVRDGLEALANEPGVRQSVLTGNSRDVAHIKVESFGLDGHLDLSIGAFGDDHRERAELVGIACRRAAQQLGVTFSAEEVVLIGDTPNDVHAAVTSGAHVIAVATGGYSVDELRAAGAKVCLESLAGESLVTEIGALSRYA